MVRCCAILSCKNSRDTVKSPETKWFRFPTDQKRCHEWIILSGREELLHKEDYHLKLYKHYFLCDLHFDQKDYESLLDSFDVLPNDVLPKLNLPPKTSENHIIYLMKINDSKGTNKSLGTTSKEIIKTNQKEIIKKIVEKQMNTEPERNIKIIKRKSTEKGLDERLKKAKTYKNALIVPGCSKNIDITEDGVTQINVVPKLKINKTNLKTIEQSLDGRFKNASIVAETSQNKYIVENKGELGENLRKLKSFIDNLKFEEDFDSKSNFIFNTLEENTLKLEKNASSSNLLDFEADDKETDSSLSNPTENLQKALHDYKQTCNDENTFLYFALNLYLLTPTPYNILQKSLDLPSIKKLRKTKIPVSTKLSEQVKICLKSKTKNLKESDKYCVVIAEVVPLKNNLYYNVAKDKIIGTEDIGDEQSSNIATSSILLMARGISSNWKQLLGYCFFTQNRCENSLNTWIDNILIDIEKIGLRVVVLTSKRTPFFIKMADKRGVTLEKPFFKVNEKPIYYIFDVPDLVQSIRNVLKDDNKLYYFNKGKKEVASWKYVNIMYVQDKGLLSRLSSRHIVPTMYEQANTVNAIQAFSQHVSTAISCYAHEGDIPMTSMGTAKFIKMLDNLVNILNSYPCNDKCKDCKAFKMCHKDNNVINDFIATSLTLVFEYNGTEFMYDDSRACLEGLKFNCKSILTVASELLANHNLKHIFTSRFNVEPMNQFVENVLMSSPFKTYLSKGQYPTAKELEIAFKKQFLADLLNMSKIKKTNNDLDNLEKNALNLQNIMKEKKEKNPLNVRNIRGHRIELPNKNKFSFVCSYLLEKFNEKRSDKVDNFIGKLEMDVQPKPTQYQPTKSMNLESDTFKKIVISMDRTLDVTLLRMAADGNFSDIGKKCLMSLVHLQYESQSRFPLELKKLFVRFRIYNLVKMNVKLLQCHILKYKTVTIKDKCVWFKD